MIWTLFEIAKDIFAVIGVFAALFAIVLCWPFGEGDNIAPGW